MANNDDVYVPFDQEFKDSSNVKGGGNSKLNCELFHEEDDIVNDMFRVKRIGSGIAEKWRVYKNDKVVLTMLVSSLSIEQAEYLRTADGLKDILSLYKSGIKDISILISRLMVK